MKILLCGFDGSMGQVFSELYSIEAGFSLKEAHENFQTFTDLQAIDASLDVIVDFSHHSLTESIIDFALEKKLPLVIATTNLNDALHEKIQKASLSIPILQSGNFSKGMNVVARMTQELTKLLKDFDLEIEEKHHRYKEDAPSGSAQMLFKAAKKERNDLIPIYDRHQENKKRQANEVGMHSLRGGSVVGEHSVYFFGHDELVEIKHTALSKKVFAQGAFEAALYLAKQNPGRFTYEDVIFHD